MRSGLLRTLITLTAFAAVLVLLFCACGCREDTKPDDATPSVVDVSVPTDGAIPADTVEPTSPQTTEGVTDTDEPAGSNEPSESPESSETPIQSEETTPGTSEELSSAQPTASTFTPTATPTSGATAGTTPAPTPTAPAQTDPYAAAVWFDDSSSVRFDMDFDGKYEDIKIDMVHQSGYNYTCTVSVTLGSNGKVLKDSFNTEYFTKAVVYNFNSGDHRAELLVCCGTGNRGQVTKMYRINSGETALQSIATSGWVETLADNAIELGRYIDVLGTWACSCRFAFSTSNFSLVQVDDSWQVHRDSDRWCTVSQMFVVELIISNSSENYAGFLYYGDRLYPTETDLKTYIGFVSDLGDRGNITITVGSNGDLLINGKTADNWFLDLEYIR